MQISCDNDGCMGQLCCGHRQDDQEQIQGQRRVLGAALLINAVVFIFELGGGLLSHSEAVLADSVHLLSHLLVIGISLFVVSRDQLWKLKAALLKSLIIFGLSLNILFEAVDALSNPHHSPQPLVMSAVSVVAFLGNVGTFWLMARYRNQDLNMKSAWVCSQADLLTNLGLFFASVLVAVFHSGIPDVMLSIALGLFIAFSSATLMRQSLLTLLR